jgi:hypothetical protein
MSVIEIFSTCSGYVALLGPGPFLAQIAVKSLTSAIRP